jgi:hypothetical protein
VPCALNYEQGQLFYSFCLEGRYRTIIPVRGIATADAVLDACEKTWLRRSRSARLCQRGYVIRRGQSRLKIFFLGRRLLSARSFSARFAHKTRHQKWRPETAGRKATSVDPSRPPQAWHAQILAAECILQRPERPGWGGRIRTSASQNRNLPSPFPLRVVESGAGKQNEP